MTSFRRFQDSWTDQLHQLVEQLTKGPARPRSNEDNHQVRQVVDKVVSHYAEYYDAKASVGRNDVLVLFAAPWASALERSLHWVAGFRPTTIFHLMYTESSIRFESHVADILRGRRTGDLGELSPVQLGRVSELQCLTVKEERSLHWVAGFRPTTIFHLMYTESSIRFESHVADILRGRRTGDLGELSPVQLGRVSELQCLTVKEENEIGDELGAWQEAVARAEPEWAGLCGNAADGLERLLEKLGEVVAKADDLRMRTIRRMVELLTPQQAAEFLVAAAELQFGIRAWGLHHDRERGAGRGYC